MHPLQGISTRIYFGAEKNMDYLISSIKFDVLNLSKLVMSNMGFTAYCPSPD